MYKMNGGSKEYKHTGTFDLGAGNNWLVSN